MSRVVTLVFVALLLAAVAPIASASGGNYIYTFNAADQLVAVSSGGTQVAAFTYDGDNLRVSKTAAGVGTIYVRGASGEVLAEYSATGDLLAEYVYLDGKRLCKITTDAKGTEHRTYYHGDLVGTPLALTDENGAIASRGEYYPFGDEVVANAIPDPHKFTGKELDEEIGLYYFNARYYDAQLGRFVSVDPIGGGIANLQSWNRYAYVENNPLKFVDPDGETLTIAWSSDSDLTQITTGIYQLTGLVLSVDQGGRVSVAGDSYSSGRRKQASGVARSLIIEAISSDEDFSVSLVRADKKTTLGKALGRKVTIDMADSVSSQSVDTRTMDATMTLFHELLHSVRDTVDVDNSHSDPGQTVPIVNLIRDRAGLPRRTSYFYTATGQHTGELQFDGGTVDFENK